MSEATLSQRVRTNLEREGAYVIKVLGTRLGRAGVGDLVICFQGRFFMLEGKLDAGEEPSPVQKDERRKVLRAGGVWAKYSSVAEARAALGLEGS